MKLLYLHGLGSGGNTTTARTLQKHLPQLDVISPDIPVHPRQAMVMLRKIAKTLRPDDIIVGTSMGGRYALLFRGWRRIAINPSLHTSRVLRTMIGQDAPFHLERQDGAKTYHVDEGLCREYEQAESTTFLPSGGIIAPWFDPRTDQQMVTGLFAIQDTLTGYCKKEFLQHYPISRDFEGTHRLSPQVTREVLSPLLEGMIHHK